MTTPHPSRFRALDLSMGWAGPLLGALLAEMNFDVVKIEDTRNFDWWRGPLNIAAPELRPIERSPTFNTVNRGKRGITLDLTNPRGVEIVKRLAAHADVAIENFAPGVMARLGLSWEALAAVNPRLVMVSMPSFGAGGPESDARGYGNTVEAMAGVTSLNRYHDHPQPYTMSNALGDPVGGLNGTLAVLAALHERERTGRGQLVEIAQVEAAIPFLADRIIEYQFTGRVPEPRGNRHSDYAPHGIYRCEGDDAWLALAAETEEQWRGLIDALALGGLADDARFADRASRKTNEDALDLELSRALATLTVDDVARRLNSAGVFAQPVSSAPEVLADSHLQARSFFVPVDREVSGTHLYPGPVPRLSRTPLSADRPAPLLGQHNVEVLRELLGMTDDEIRALESAAIIGSVPRA
jgi:crotonobetainyl-CoA:carnitine CoA-transferase CaiB-like acyl-CoA transferase